MVIMPPVFDPFPHALGGPVFLYADHGLTLLSLGLLWVALFMISLGAVLDNVRWKRPVAG
jgi:hypothetical protein